MLNKGFELSWVFLLVVAVAFVMLASGFMFEVVRKSKPPNYESIVDVRYACVNYNEGGVNKEALETLIYGFRTCLLYTSPSPRDGLLSRMPSSA